MIVTTGGRGVTSTADSSPLSGGRINIFRSLLFERDHVGFGAEEARHFARQFGVERLVHGRENTAAEQARDQIFHADIELLRQIFNADAFRDRDIARDRHRLIRHHHARRRRVALHRAFFYATRNIALAGPARGRTRTSCQDEPVLEAEVPDRHRADAHPPELCAWDASDGVRLDAADAADLRRESCGRGR